MIEAILYLDRFLTNLIFNLPHPFILTSFFGFFAAKGVTLVIWLAIFVYLIFFEEKRDQRFIIYFILALTLSTLAYVSLKQISKRPRPLAANLTNLTNSDQFQLTPTDYPTDYAFPSGHATLSFAAAAILSAFDKKRKKYFYLIASLIVLSRVYLGYHYVFDVIVGALLGWFIARLVLIESMIDRKS